MKLNQFIKSLNGKKTYITAGATILYCLLGIYSHYMSVPAALSVIGTSGSLVALRLGVSKLQVVLEVAVELLKVISQAEKPAEVPPAVPTPPAPVAA